MECLYSILKLLSRVDVFVFLIPQKFLVLGLSNQQFQDV